MQQTTSKENLKLRRTINKNTWLHNESECSQAIQVNNKFVCLEPHKSIIVLKGDVVAYNKLLIYDKEIY